MEILIKPHHFVDILKLYGAGIEVFVPDERMKHDFYRVANVIVGNQHAVLRLTVGSDDICRPCNKCKAGRCEDGLEHIPGFTSKERYNYELDNRIMAHVGVNRNEQYEAGELCAIFLEHHEFVFSVWQEENDEITKKRHSLFVAGAVKYLSFMDS